MVHLAVMGAGAWGMNLIRNIAQCPNTELLAVCDPDETARRAVASRYRHAMTFTDPGAMLQVSGLDAVVVATPPASHLEHARMVLERGLDVLVEKPLCMSSRDADALVGLAESSGRILMVGHTFVYNNVVQEVRRRIEAGELGDVRYIYSQRLNLGRLRPDVDAFWNLAPHDISIANTLLGGRPLRVSARGACFVNRSRGLADVGFFQMDYPGGVMVHGHVSWLDPQKVRKAVVVGSERMLVYDDMDTSRHIQVYDKSVETDFQSPTANFSDFSGRVRAGDLIVPNVRLKEPLAAEIEHFAACVLNRSQPTTDGRAGRDLVAVLEAITESADRDGVCVDVNYAVQSRAERKRAAI